MNFESDLPSWHPKLVSYDVEGVNNLEVGPPMLKKNEIAKFDDIIVYRGHFYVKGKLEQKKTQSTQLVEDENELPWDREERKANEMLEKEKSKKEKKRKTWENASRIGSFRSEGLRIRTRKRSR